MWYGRERRMNESCQDRKIFAALRQVKAIEFIPSNLASSCDGDLRQNGVWGIAVWVLEHKVI